MRELYDRNIFGPLRLKDTQFPVDQDIQSPVLHAFTKDRGFYEDCTTPGMPTLGSPAQTMRGMPGDIMLCAGNCLDPGTRNQQCRH